MWIWFLSWEGGVWRRFLFWGSVCFLWFFYLVVCSLDGSFRVFGIFGVFFSFDYFDVNMCFGFFFV